MKKRLFVTALVLTIMSLTSITHAQNRSFDRKSHGNVYVMDNNPEDNQIISYFRSRSGRLINIGSYSTQGLGAGDNAPADPLGSQNSIALSEDEKNLYVVNAGSDDISVFRLFRFGLPRLIQKISSNGDFPVSLAIQDDVMYVLNSGSDGAISGFRIGRFGRLRPIGNSTRALALGATGFPQGDARNLAPGDISFDSLNRRLLIAYAGGGTSGQLLSFELNDDDTPADVFDAVSSQGAVPFSLDFTEFGTAIVAEASGSLSSYNYGADNDLISVSSVIGNGQQATCWIVAIDDFAYSANTVSGTLSLYNVKRNGEINLLNAQAANVGAPIDFGVTEDERFMYVVSSTEGGVQGFRVNPNTGALISLGTFAGLPTFDANGYAPQGIAVK